MRIRVSAVMLSHVETYYHYIQVGLNMHLYDDIGDASSSLWGLTSSYHLFSFFSKGNFCATLLKLQFVK